MVHDDDFEFEHHSLLQNRANMQNNVLTKRKEQLKDWEASEVNKMTAARKPANQAKVKFQDSDIFLSACVSGDEDEVEDLLDKGANINVSTIDGVTALHQAVIDDNLDMVRFLVEHKADINAQDNEGWTPLHAAVCCGSLPIAKYLCEMGADLTLTNSDKELAVDLAESDDIRDYLEEQIRAKKVDVEKCREREFQLMMKDCGEWIRAGRYLDRPHPRTGATALHVAVSKGYNQLIGMLIHAGADVNAQDKEGWTPLHAAAHWAEKDACRILMENGANTDIETFSGQNVLMVADKSIVDYLTELQENFRELRKVALAQQQEQKEVDTSRESSLSKSVSASSASSATSRSLLTEPVSNGSSVCSATASASFTLPQQPKDVISHTTGISMISSARNFIKPNDGQMNITLRATSMNGSKKLEGRSEDEEEDYTEEAGVEEEEYEEEEMGQEEEAEEEDEEISAETATSSTTNKTQPPSASADVLKTAARSTSQPFSREVTNTTVDRKYIFDEKNSSVRRLATNDRQSSLASTSSGSVEESEEVATGSQVSSIATTSRSVTPKDQSSSLYSSDQNIECTVSVDSSNVSTRRYIHKLPNTTVDKQRGIDDSSSKLTWNSERIKSDAPLSLSSSASSISALADDRRPTNRAAQSAVPVLSSSNNLAPLARISSISSISEVGTTATTTFSSSSSSAMLKNNNAFTMDVTACAAPVMTSRITANNVLGINRVQLPPWIAESEGAKASNGNAVSFERRLMKPTIATSAKISAKVPNNTAAGSSLGNSSTNAMTSSIYGMLPGNKQNGSQSLNYNRGTTSVANNSNGSSFFSTGANFNNSASSVSSLTPPTQPSSNRESESERKAKSRLQRHSRRSTQGVTLEHVGEAARHISTSSSSIEDSTDRLRNASQKKHIAESNSEKYLSSDKKIDDQRQQAVTQSLNVNSSESAVFSKWRSHVTSASAMTDGLTVDVNKQPSTVVPSNGPTVSAYFKLPPHNYVSASSSSRSTNVSTNAISGKSPTSSSQSVNSLATSSSARLNRRSQIVRGNRRGTGPVDMEAITAASSVRSSGERKISAEESPHKTSKFTFGKAKPEIIEVENTARNGADDSSSVQAESTYKLMYEKELETSGRLQQRVDELTRQLAKQSIPNNGVMSRGVHIDDQERRSFERRIAALEYELEKSKQLQSDYEKLKDENMALIRVLRKLSK